MTLFATCETEIGWIGFARTEKGISRLTLPKVTEGAAIDDLKANVPELYQDIAPFRGLIEKLQNYCRGERIEFDEDLDLSGHTPFRQDVWRLTRAIPYGRTRSYGSIARELNRPAGARAVGQAMGANPVLLIIPCHRVVASDGTLHGFGGGLPMKERLLKLEGAIPAGSTKVKG